MMYSSRFQLYEFLITIYLIDTKHSPRDMYIWPSGAKILELQCVCKSSVNTSSLKISLKDCCLSSTKQ